MPTLERSCDVKMRVDDAEQCWNEFVSQQSQQQQQAGNGAQAKGTNDPGTVYFNSVDDGTTKVTMQLNSDGIVEGDEQTLNQRVDGYLQKFKQFAEAR